MSMIKFPLTMLSVAALAVGEAYEPNVLCYAESADGMNRKKWRANPMFTLATALCLTVMSFSAVSAQAAHPFTYAHWNIGHFAIGRSNKSTIATDKAEARLKEFRSWMDIGADWFGISEYAPEFTADGSVKTGAALFGDYDLQNVGPNGCFQWNAQFGKSSRFKVLESKTVFYKTHCQACYYLAQRVLIDGKTEAWIVQTHFDWKSWQINEAQFKELVEAFRDCPRVIVSGDFNWVVADCRRDQRHWNDQFRAHGYDLALDDLWVAPGTGGGSKTTHVFIDNIAVKGFEISEPGVVYDADRKMSDHFIVHCRLTPTKNAHTHVPGPWKVVKDPTATAPGERVRTCTVAGCRHAERRTMEPLEYAWLETDGSTCIATDYVPDLEKTVVEITFRFLDLNPKDGHALCWANAATEGRRDDSPCWGAIWWPGDGKPLFDCGSAPGEAVIGEGFTDTKDFHTLVFGGNRAVLDGKKAVGKEKPAKGKAGGPLALFTRWCVSAKSEESYDKNASKIRVKSIRIWEGDGAKRKLVHHYVPAKNGCEATFYDTVEKRYLRTLGRTMLCVGGCLAFHG